MCNESLQTENEDYTETTKQQRYRRKSNKGRKNADDNSKDRCAEDNINIEEGVQEQGHANLVMIE